MNPRDFHQLASELLTNERAVDFRTAISRAYYAVYNVGVEILHQMGFEISKGSAGHGEVMQRLSNSGEVDVIKVGNQLGPLRGKRNHADYYLDDRNVELPKTAQGIVAQTHGMIQVLDGCLTEPKRGRIINAIKTWLQSIYGEK